MAAHRDAYDDYLDIYRLFEDGSEEIVGFTHPTSSGTWLRFCWDTYTPVKTPEQLKREEESDWPSKTKILTLLPFSEFVGASLVIRPTAKTIKAWNGIELEEQYAIKNKMHNNMWFLTGIMKPYQDECRIQFVRQPISQIDLFGLSDEYCLDEKLEEAAEKQAINEAKALAKNVELHESLHVLSNGIFDSDPPEHVTITTQRRGIVSIDRKMNL